MRTWEARSSHSSRSDRCFNPPGEADGAESWSQNIRSLKSKTLVESGVIHPWSNWPAGPAVPEFLSSGSAASGLAARPARRREGAPGVYRRGYCIDRRCLALVRPQPQPQGGALASSGSASSVRQTWRCRTTMVQHPHHLKSALLCTWMTLGDGGSYLGIGSDAHGLYRTPPPALRTLRSDFHFARDHSLAVGEPPLLLSEISAFGGSMHLQLDVMGSNASTFALELSVLGGASTVSVEHIAPPRDQCTGAQNLVKSLRRHRSFRSRRRVSM